MEARRVCYNKLYGYTKKPEVRMARIPIIR